jgi:hypothetical protein
MATAVPRENRTPAVAAATALGVGAVVAVSLGVYAKAHSPAHRPLFSLGFSGTLPMKAWLTTSVIALVIFQLVTALWMWGRLPGAGPAPAWAAIAHRWIGAAAFIISLPVAFHCIWSLGFADTDARVLVHSIAGCAFYGAYAAKMTGLRLSGLPGWALPVLGGLVLTSLVVLWLTASVWFFTRSGLPLT